MCLPVIDVMKTSLKIDVPLLQGENQDVFFSAFVLSTTQTSKTNKQEKTTI